MPPSTNAPDDIIEKKDTAPVTTACLVIAAVALVAAIVIQLMEIGQYRREPLKTVTLQYPGAALADQAQKEFKGKVAALIQLGPTDEAATHGGDDVKDGQGKDVEPKDDAEKTDEKAAAPPAGAKAGKKKGAEPREPEPEPKADSTDADLKDKDAAAPADAEPAADKDEKDK